MLILTRRPRESISIGDDIKLVVLSIDDRGFVRLGIDAPEDVKILRGELVKHNKIKD